VRGVRRWFERLAMAILSAFVAWCVPALAATELLVGFDDQTWVDQAADFLEYFAAKYPEISVRVTAGINQENIVVMMAGGSTPDVYYVRGTWSRGFIERGFLEPLDPYVRASGFDLSIYNPVMLSAYQNDAGETFALPTDLGMVFTYLNTDHLARAGIAFPQSDWTWDEALDIARRLTSVEGDSIARYGWSVPLGANWLFEGLSVAPWGGRLFNDSETETWVTRPEAISGLAWWESALAVVPRGGDFVSGSSSMLVDGGWNIKHFNASLTEVHWDIAPIPRGPVMRATPTQGSGYGISPLSTNKDAAWVFMQEFLGPIGQEMIWGRGSIPAARSALPVFLEETVGGKNHAAIYEAFETAFIGRPIMPPGEGAFVQRASGPIASWLERQISSQQLAVQLKTAIEAMWSERNP